MSSQDRAKKPGYHYSASLRSRSHRYPQIQGGGNNEDFHQSVGAFGVPRASGVALEANRLPRAAFRVSRDAFFLTNYINTPTGGVFFFFSCKNSPG